MSHFVPRPATYARHHSEEPQVRSEDGSRTWITRGQNFVIAVTDAKPGAVLSRNDNPDEYMLVLPPGTTAVVETPEETISIEGDSLTILPPGRSTVILGHASLVVTIFSSRAADLADLAGNATVYKTGQSQSQPLTDWPPPNGGFKVRTYDLSKYAAAGGQLIQPRIFRSTNLMINAFLPFVENRPTNEMRPHWHDDFEQASVALSGEWVHHIRTPWGTDLADWRPDEHGEVGSPSVTIIPETLIHASRNTGETPAWLIDVFSPPRVDFSQAGIVLNAEDYPMPETLTVAERDVPAAWRNTK